MKGTYTASVSSLGHLFFLSMEEENLERDNQAVVCPYHKLPSFHHLEAAQGRFRRREEVITGKLQCLSLS